VTLDYRAGLAAAVLLAATYAFGRVRLWLAARREAKAQRGRSGPRRSGTASMPPRSAPPGPPS
jgi:hypothetical protein